MDLFEQCPTDIKLYILNLCEARALGRFCLMSRGWNRLLTRNEQIWRTAFLREISSDPQDAEMFQLLVAELGGAVKRAFGVFFHAMAERAFRLHAKAYCVAVVGDTAVERVRHFASLGATEEIASGLPHLLGGPAPGCLTLRRDGWYVTLAPDVPQSVESLLQFDAVLIALHEPIGEVALKRLLRLIYKVPVCVMLLASSMVPLQTGTRFIDLEVHSVSPYTLHRVLTRDLPRLCGELTRLQLYNHSDGFSSKRRRRLLAKILARMYPHRERLCSELLPAHVKTFQEMGFVGKPVAPLAEEREPVSEITGDLEEHFAEVLESKRKQLDNLEVVLLSAGFRWCFVFESELDKVDMEEYCSGAYSIRRLAAVLRDAMQQDSFPQRWAPAIHGAKALLKDSMFTQRPALAEFLGFVDGARHCIRRFALLDKAGAPSNNCARFAAIECLEWAMTGELGQEHWEEEVRLSLGSSRSDVRAAATELKSRVLIWGSAYGGGSNTSDQSEESDPPVEEVEILEPEQSPGTPASAAKPPGTPKSLATPTKRPAATAVAKKTTWGHVVVRSLFSGVMLYLLFKYRGPFELEEAATHLREARYPDCISKLQSLQSQELDELQKRRLHDLMGQAFVYTGQFGRALRYLPASSPFAAMARLTGLAEGVDVLRCCALVEQLCKTGMVGRAQRLAELLVQKKQTNDTLLAQVVALTTRSARDELEQAAALFDQMSAPLSQRACFYRSVVLCECGRHGEALEQAASLPATPRHLLLRARISSRAGLARQAAELFESSWQQGVQPGEALDAACSAVLERLKCGELSEAMRVFGTRVVPTIPVRFVAENSWDRDEQLAIEERMRRVAPAFSELVGPLCRALCESGQVPVALSILNQWRTLTAQIKYEDDVALCEWSRLLLAHGGERERALVERAMEDAVEKYASFYKETTLSKAPATRELAVLLVLLVQSNGGAESPHMPHLMRVVTVLGFRFDPDWKALYSQLAFSTTAN